MYLVGFFIGLPTLRAQNDDDPRPSFDEADFERQIQAAMQAEGIGGLAVAVVEGDAILYLAGLSGRDAPPPNPYAAYDLGRAAEPFLTTLFFHLAERGLIEPASRLRQIWPRFALGQENATSSLIAAQLMTHTGGLGSADLAPMGSLSLEVVAELPLSNFPGERFSYCAACTGLLVTLLEDLSGQTLDDLLHEAILDPLHMDATQLNPDGHLLSSAADMAHFMSIHLQNGRWQGVQIIKPESVTALHGARNPTERDRLEAYGYGWFVYYEIGLAGMDRANDRVIVSRDMGEGRALMALAPGYNRGVLLLSPEPTAGLDSILAVALEALFGYVPADYEPLANQAITGVYTSSDARLGGRLSISAGEDGLTINYDEVSTPATYVADRVLGFEHEGRAARFYLADPWGSGRGVLSVDGVTAIYTRGR